MSPTATFDLPVNGTFTATTNSGQLQRAVIADSAGNQLWTAQGSGTRVQIGSGALSAQTGLTVTLSWSADNGVTWQTSDLNNGGPYAIGRLRMFTVVGENGDDTDYNDLILQFTWRQ